jgi:hypothetical protein
MRDIVWKGHSAIECARFIREYSGTKGFCESSGHCISHIITMIIRERVGKNIVAKRMISSQSNALDELMQQFLDQIDRDIATFVYSAVKYSISTAWFMQGRGTGYCEAMPISHLHGQIYEWINISGGFAPRAMWLCRPRGKGNQPSPTRAGQVPLALLLKGVVVRRWRGDISMESSICLTKRSASRTH